MQNSSQIWLHDKSLNSIKLSHVKAGWGVCEVRMKLFKVFKFDRKFEAFKTWKCWVTVTEMKVCRRKLRKRERSEIIWVSEWAELRIYANSNWCFRSSDTSHRNNDKNSSWKLDYFTIIFSGYSKNHTQCVTEKCHQTNSPIHSGISSRSHFFLSPALPLSLFSFSAQATRRDMKNLYDTHPFQSVPRSSWFSISRSTPCETKEKTRRRTSRDVNDDDVCECARPVDMKWKRKMREKTPTN